ncbi:MAG: helix-turn-helix domain-containing protein [Planctomycetota bacterium]
MHENPSRQWLLEMADIEDTCRSVAVGGMAADLSLVEQGESRSQKVFGRLIEFARRARGLSLEELATQADVDLDEIVAIERDEDAIPRLRTVYQLAQVLRLPVGSLTEVAGLAKPRQQVSEAALRFAARSKPTARLSKAEQHAFEEFVKVLTEGV